MSNFELNKDNYFSEEANKKYLSCSSLKGFIKCEAAELAKINGDYKYEDKTCFLLGSYVHAWAESEESFSKFIEENRTYIFQKTKKGEKYKEFKEADERIKYLENNKNQYKILFNLIRHKTVEHEKIFTCNLFGIDFKIMIDIYNPTLNLFADLKYMKSVDDKFWNGSEYVNFIFNYKYDWQMVVYSEVERIANNRKEPLVPILLTITKQNPPGVYYFRGFDNIEIRKDILNKVQIYIERIKELKEGKVTPINCNKCDYCRETQGVQVIKDYSKYTI